jgi:hypothetical protein
MLDFDTGQEEDRTVAKDTPLTHDLFDHLERRKEQRLSAIATTEKVSRFFLGWSLNASGFFVARWLLLIGGSTNLWLAASLCFAIASTSSFASLSGVSANYKEGGAELTGGEKLVEAMTGLGVSGSVTFLACKDFIKFQEVSDATIEQIKHDISDLQNPSFWGDPVVMVVGVLLLGVGVLKILSGGNRRE